MLPRRARSPRSIAWAPPCRQKCGLPDLGLGHSSAEKARTGEVETISTLMSVQISHVRTSPTIRILPLRLAVVFLEFRSDHSTTRTAPSGVDTKRHRGMPSSGAGGAGSLGVCRISNWRMFSLSSDNYKRLIKNASIMKHPRHVSWTCCHPSRNIYVKCSSFCKHSVHGHYVRNIPITCRGHQWSGRPPRPAPIRGHG